MEDVEEGEGILSQDLAQPDVKPTVGLVSLGRAVGLALVEVVGPGMVYGVGVLPREVRHEDEGVEDEAEYVVEDGHVGEGVVPALVAQNPFSIHME